MENNSIEIKFKTLTPLWTGDVDGKCTKIKETGIIGSLRWWYEALVRGLGGYACDPTSENSCSLDYNKYKRARQSGKSRQEILDKQICPACQLFGCTGWRKRFRLELDRPRVKDFRKGRGNKAGLKPQKKFNLLITPLIEIPENTKWLFKKTWRMIEKYGAIGGRTTWKPESSWGTDYGLVGVEDYGRLENWDSLSSKRSVTTWLTTNKKELSKVNDANWFNFRYYWTLNQAYLNKEQMNKIVNRLPENPSKYQNQASQFDRWLGGKRGESKKIFSFKIQQRTFGYASSEEEVETIRDKLKGLNESYSIRTGRDILESLQ